MAKMRYCSFCGKSRIEVFYLVEGPADVNICDECVILVTDIVQAAHARAERGDPIDQGHQTLKELKYNILVRTAP